MLIGIRARIYDRETGKYLCSRTVYVLGTTPFIRKYDYEISQTWYYAKLDETRYKVENI